MNFVTSPSNLMRLRQTAAVLGCIFASHAYALGLGEAELRSALGQPLHIRVPISTETPEEAGCVTLRGRPDLPLPPGLRTQILSTQGNTFIDISGFIPVNDPVLSIVVSAGCSSTISREYVFFLDPPVTPTVAATDAPLPLSTSGNAVASAASPSEAAAAPAPAAAAAAPPTRARNPRPRRPAPRPAPAPSIAGSEQRAAADASTESVSPPPAAPPASRPPAGARSKVNPVVPVRPARPEAAHVPPAAVAAAASGGGDRLRLSRPDGEAQLRIDDSLTQVDPNAVPPEEKAKLRDGQTRLMAELAGKDPGSVPTERELALQKQLKDLASDIATLRQQVKDVNERNRALEARANTNWIVWAVGALALVALALAAIFGWRYRRAQRFTAQHPWWEHTQMALPPEAVAAAAGSAASTAGPEDEPAPEGGAPDELQPQDIGPHGEAVSATQLMVTDVVGGGQAALLKSGPSRSASISETEVEPPVPMIPVARRAPPPPPEPEQDPEPMMPPMAVPAAPRRPASPQPPTQPRASAPAPARPAPPPRPPEPAGNAFDMITSLASLDDRVTDFGNSRPELDFELDLPDPAAPAPAPMASVNPAGTVAVDLPLADAGKRSESGSETPMGVDTILRMDDPQAGATDQNPDQVGVQFRLIQFASVIDQATELQSKGEPNKAIALLRQYVLRDETIPTLMWIMLFDLYKMVNKRPVYEALADHFNRRYKRAMIGWDETLEVKTPQVGLNDLPLLDARIRGQWGTHEGVEQLRHWTCGRDQPDTIIFNATLQRELLQLAKVYPLDEAG